MAAGSLLEVVLAKEKFPIPVGRVTYYHLGPMSFFEFLIAIDQTVLFNQLRNISTNIPVIEALHEKAFEMLNVYAFVGGMPEVVASYSKHRDFSRVKKLHKDLIQTYKDDISKYAPMGVNNPRKVLFGLVQNKDF